MGFIGFIVSIISGIFLLVGLIPFLGWLNWFTTLPLSVLGIILCSVAVSKRHTFFGTTGLVISIAVFAVAIIRLAIGGGIF